MSANAMSADVMSAIASMSVRRGAETAARVAALSLLAVMCWRVLPRTGDVQRASTPVTLRAETFARDSSGQATVRALLPIVLRRSDSTASAYATLRAVPFAASRAALAAAAGGGLAFHWTDSTGARDLALSATSTGDPDGRVIVLASGSRAALTVRDNGGVLDSTDNGRNGLNLLVRRSASWIDAQQGASRARVAAPPAAMVKRVLVFARPGWESKFTIAALEEAGWRVDASMAVAPRAFVTVGAPAALDTARYAAAIVLDSGLARAATLMRYSNDGGGVIVAGDGMTDPALSSLLPVRATELRIGVPGGLLSPRPLAGLDRFTLLPTSRAIVLAREGATATLAVTRYGAGRVLAVAFRESWRWRMEGATDSERAHRMWWAGLVRTVAFAPVALGGNAASDDAVALLMAAGLVRHADDPAPYADLVARVGPAVAVPPRTAPPRTALSRTAPPRTALSRTAPPPTDPQRERWNLVMLVTSVALLCGEWASRRLRGVR